MSIVDYFRDWMANNEERKNFKEAWTDKHSKELGPTNGCIPYHEQIAYEIYKLTKRVEELENNIKQLKGSLAQRLEQVPVKYQVGGSIPSGAYIAGVAQW